MTQNQGRAVVMDMGGRGECDSVRVHEGQLLWHCSDSGVSCRRNLRGKYIFQLLTLTHPHTDAKIPTQLLTEW